MIDLRHWGATEAEVASAMPGDELFDGQAQVGTRAIDIAAEPELVFDFLAQMGFGRAGWYSYDWLDNLGRKSASEVHPDWLVESSGESVPGGPIQFLAVVVERPAAYVLQIPNRGAIGYSLDFTLAYRLDKTASGTRLTSRVRIAIDGPLGQPLSHALLLGDGAMVRRQLLGIKARCESI